MPLAAVSFKKLKRFDLGRKESFECFIFLVVAFFLKNTTNISYHYYSCYFREFAREDIYEYNEY